MILRQSTAVDVLIGPFVDSTDGDTEETALTINAADVLLSKNGQGLTLKTDVTAAAHDADGYYNCEFDATDTATVGTLVLTVHVSGALAVRHEYQVVEEAVYDAMFAAGAVGPLAADDDGTNLIEAGGDGDHLTAINLPNQTMDIIGDITGNLSGSVGSLTGHTNQTADHTAGIAAIKAITDLLTLAAINAEVDTALATTTYAEPGSVPAATASLKDKIGWLCALARNKGTQTATTKTLRNDADSADIATSAISNDGTTFIRAEYT